MSSALNGTQQFTTRIAAALLLLGWCGCAAPLATVKIKPARLPTALRAEEPLDSATKYLVAAEHEQSLPALGHDLLAAKISYAVLERQPKNQSARSIYNFAVARVVHDVDRRRAHVDHDTQRGPRAEPSALARHSRVLQDATRTGEVDDAADEIALVDERMRQRDRLRASRCARPG